MVASKNRARQREAHPSLGDEFAGERTLARVFSRSSGSAPPSAFPEDLVGIAPVQAAPSLPIFGGGESGYLPGAQPLANNQILKSPGRGL